MKITPILCLSLALTLPLVAYTTNRADKMEHTLKPASGKPAQKSITATVPGGAVQPSSGKTPAASPPSTQAPSVATTAAPSGVTLDAYIDALADKLSLTKSEKTDIKTFYLEDGAKLQAVLNDATLSPLEQTRQVDDLRNSRNSKIDALLRDVDRQQVFDRLEADYRVALIELAAAGGLVPATPPPNVPHPTATPPGQADKTAVPAGA